MKSTNIQKIRKIFLIALCSFLWVYNNAQINTYSDCIKGISYYIQTDENHDATVTIDMSQAHSNVYLSNIVCYFYPIDLNMNKLSSTEMQYGFKNPLRWTQDKRYVATFNAKIYNNADGLMGTKINCDCHVEGQLYHIHVIKGVPPPKNLQAPRTFKNSSVDASNNSPIFTSIQSSNGVNLLGTYLFPGGGESNNNGFVGDFCCTGETGTVMSKDNFPIGYIYNYDFKGGYNISDNQSIATQFSILVSGISDINNNQSDRIKQSIDFTTDELYKGSVKSVRAGVLNFTVTILDVSKYSDPGYYLMGSVKTKVDVSIAEN